MSAIATHPRARGDIKLLIADHDARVHGMGSMLTLLHHLRAGDVLVVNDAFTIPASFECRLATEEAPFEARLLEAPDAEGTARAVLFGPGSSRMRTEERPPPPRISAGQKLWLGGHGELHAMVSRVLDHPRLVQLVFGERGAPLWTQIFSAGKPIQYAYMKEALALYDVQTTYAGVPYAAEMPSAGYGLSFRVLNALRNQQVGLARVTHAAGISSTGDPELDSLMPFRERSIVSHETAALVNDARRRGHRIIAVGTSVVRALESSVNDDGQVSAGAFETSLRINGSSTLHVVDIILTGMHAPGESHYDLLEAFASRSTLDRLASIAAQAGFLSHEFGDVMWLERARSSLTQPLR